MEIKDVIQLSTIENKLTIDHAIRGTQLRAISLIMGEAATISTLSKYLITVSEFYNVQGNMSETQAYQTAGLLLETHPLLTIQDVMMAMKEAKSKVEGYEKPYGMIDGSVIFSWINTYIDRKEDRLDQMRLEEKNKQHNDLHEAGRVVFEKLACEPKPEPKKVSRDSFPSTMEKMKQHIHENAHLYEPEQIDSLIRSLTNQNMFKAYDDTIEFLKELKNSK